MDIRIQIQREPDFLDLPLPNYSTPGSAGLDLYAAVEEDLVLSPGARVSVPTGISLAIPPGYEAQVRPRSGWALRDGLGMVNAPGTIDSDFRHVVCVILINLGQKSIIIRRGDRIAQLVVAPVIHVEWDEVNLAGLPATQRSGGFGSTGIRPAGEDGNAAVIE